MDRVIVWEVPARQASGLPDAQAPPPLERVPAIPCVPAASELWLRVLESASTARPECASAEPPVWKMSLRQAASRDRSEPFPSWAWIYRTTAAALRAHGPTGPWDELPPRQRFRPGCVPLSICGPPGN